MDLFAIFDSCYQALPGCFLHALTCSTCCSLCSSCPAQVRTITNGSCSSSQVKFVITTKHFFNINRFLRNVMKCNTSIRLIPISLASSFFFFFEFLFCWSFSWFFLLCLFAVRLFENLTHVCYKAVQHFRKDSKDSNICNLRH